MLKSFLKVFFIFFFFQMSAFSKDFESDYKINLDWFKNFNDDILMQYIIEGLNNNNDAEIARLKILKYRQEKNLLISTEFPQLYVDSSYLLTKVPKLAIPNNDIQTNSFALPFLTYFEIDYLGKNFNKIQKGKFDIKNSTLDLKAVNLTIMTDIAANYFNLSYINSELNYQIEIKNFYKEIFDKKQALFDFGVISKTELNLAEDFLIHQENIINELQSNRETFLAELAFLLAYPPYSKSKIKVNSFEKINYSGKNFESLKGDIIFNRPDIIKAENEVKKAKIDITIAKKEFLPSINIFGVLIFSTIVQNFGWDGVLASLSVNAVQNIFDGGKRIFNLKKMKVEYDIMVQNYLKTTLLALKEVNCAMYFYKKDYETLKNNEKILKIENDNFIKVLNSLTEGEKSQIDYLNENIKKTKYEIAYQKSKNKNFIDLLSLYKVTGGAL